MRIVHVTPSMARSHGGVSTAIRGMVQAQRAAGHEAIVFTGYGRDDEKEVPAIFGRLIERDGIWVRQFPLARAGWAGRLQSCPALAQTLRNEAGTFEVAHIHSLWNWCTHQSVRACRQANLPYILSPHGGLDPWIMRQKWPVRSWYFRWVERAHLENAKGVHFTTQAEAVLAKALNLNIRPGIAPLGVEEIFFEGDLDKEAAREVFQIPKKVFVVLFVGRVQPQKALDLLLLAWSKLHGDPSDLLWIVGPSEGPYRKGLDYLVREKGIQEYIRFDPPVYGSARANLYRAADLLILCSHRENFGLTAAEAMAAGIPVLVSHPVNLAPLINQVGCGLVCDLSQEGIRDGLIKIRSLTPEERRAMGERGRGYAEKCLKWPTVEKELTAMYSEGAKDPRIEAGKTIGRDGS